MDIVEFLTARYDVDQRRAEAARAVDPTPWTASVGEDGRPNGIRATGGHAAVLTADGMALWDTEGSSTLCMTAVSAEHLAAHDPAFVLADLAAKRKLLEICRQMDAVNSDSAAQDSLADEIRRTLAAPFADRPGYNPAWKVEDDPTGPVHPGWTPELAEAEAERLRGFYGTGRAPGVHNG